MPKKKRIFAVIGKTGAGRSSYCNKIIDLRLDLYIGDNMMLGKTQMTSYHMGFPLIEVPGYSDPQGMDYQYTQQIK